MKKGSCYVSAMQNTNSSTTSKEVLSTIISETLYDAENLVKNYWHMFKKFPHQNARI